MADYQLPCTWDEVAHAALTPNVFVTMSVIQDPDLGEINVADVSGAQIYGLLQDNPKQQIIFTDLSGRQCAMTTPPVSGSSVVKFSTLVGTTLYIYSIPDGNARVYTETVDISSADSGLFVVQFTMDNSVITADQTYDDVMGAAADGKVVIGRFGTYTYYFNGDPDDDGATFFRVYFTTNSQAVAVYQLILADDESVSESSRALYSEAVRYSQQTLTNTQKAQARANIGATDGASGISDTIKQELLNCFAHVAWIDADGQDYYDALEAALYTKVVESISAVFTQGSAVIYDTDSLDTLKQYLTVTATYDDTSTAVVTAYELSGTLAVGTSVITVDYGGKTTTFNVTVTAAPRLPTAYQEVAYVSNPSNAYVATGLTVALGSTVHGKCYLSAKPSETKNVCGGLNNSANRTFCSFSTSNNYVGSFYSTTNCFPLLADLYASPLEFSTTMTGSTLSMEVKNSGGSNSKSVSASCTKTDALDVFRGSSGAVGAFVGDIYFIEIINSSNELTAQLIPCYRKSDNVAGFYDLVGNAFHSSANSTALVAGPNV